MMDSTAWEDLKGEEKKEWLAKGFKQSDWRGKEIVAGSKLHISYKNGNDKVDKKTEVILIDGHLKTNWHGEIYQIIGKSALPYIKVIE